MRSRHAPVVCATTWSDATWLAAMRARALHVATLDGAHDALGIGRGLPTAAIKPAVLL
jgi:hypothetical protein